MKFLTIQQGRYTDGQLPYPLHANEDGFIGQQGLWDGKLYKIVGAQDAVDIQRIDTYWREIWKNPEQAVGKFLVTADVDGNLSSWESPVESVRPQELDESFMEA
jgi:hypothetical protein